MHIHYIINSVIEFHPATSTLRNINYPDRIVILNFPTGRCLQLLLERTGTIVGQPEFLDIVWKNHGIQVSSNTFYQNISLLRKGLKNIGLPDNLVVTIPRLGLTLTKDTHVKKLAIYQQIEFSHKNAHYIDEQSQPNELTTFRQRKGEHKEELPLSQISAETPTEVSLLPIAEAKSSHRFSRFQWMSCVAIVMLGVAVLALFRVITF